MVGWGTVAEGRGGGISDITLAIITRRHKGHQHRCPLTHEHVQVTPGGSRYDLMPQRATDPRGAHTQKTHAHGCTPFPRETMHKSTRVHNMDGGQRGGAWSQAPTDLRGAGKTGCGWRGQYLVEHAAVGEAVVTTSAPCIKCI